MQTRVHCSKVDVYLWPALAQMPDTCGPGFSAEDCREGPPADPAAKTSCFGQRSLLPFWFPEGSAQVPPRWSPEEGSQASFSKLQDTKPTALKAIRTNDGRAQPLVSQCVLQTQGFETIGPDLLFEKPEPGGHQSAPGVTKRPHSLTIQPPSAVDAGGGMQPQSMVVYRDCEGSECRESTTSSSYLGPDQGRTQEASVARPTKTARLHNSTRPIPMRNGKRTAKQVHEQAGRCMVNILARHPRLAARLNTSPAEVAPL